MHIELPPGAKDMIGACVAAYTVAEFENGRGGEVGNDEFGTIILPLPLPDSVSPTLLRWPTQEPSIEKDIGAVRRKNISGRILWNATVEHH